MVHRSFTFLHRVGNQGNRHWPRRPSHDRMVCVMEEGMMGRKPWLLLRDNALPALVVIGLAGGALARFGLGQPELARWIWLVALVVGGTPLVVETVRGMVRGNFASDVVATLSIVTALGMGEYFAGLIIVLMQSGGEALERYSLRRASSALEQLLARAP